MKILAFDENYQDEDLKYLDILNQNLKDFKIVLIDNLEKALSLYASNDFHIVLIDFTTENGKSFLSELNRINTLQKIITMGYVINSSSDMGCEYCIKHYKKRRLVKPINPVELYKLILDFDDIICKYAFQFEDPKNLIKEIVVKYNYCLYNKEKSLIYFDKNSWNDFKQFLSLVNELREYNIDFEVLDDYSIKII